MARDMKPVAGRQAKGQMAENRNGRRCLITRQTEPVEKLVRLVLGPDGVLVPDIAAKLPGRGVWITADQTLIEDAVQSGLLHGQACRSLKMSLDRSAVPEGLADVIEHLMTRTILNRLGLEQKAGHLVTGFDKIRAALGKKSSGGSVLVLAASDSSEDGRKKIQAAVGAHVPSVVLFDREQLSRALGRDNVVHVLLTKSGGTIKLMADISRLLRLRGMTPLPEVQGNA